MTENPLIEAWLSSLTQMLEDLPQNTTLFSGAKAILERRSELTSEQIALSCRFVLRNSVETAMSTDSDKLRMSMFEVMDNSLELFQSLPASLVHTPTSERSTRFSASLKSAEPDLGGDLDSSLFLQALEAAKPVRS